MPVGAVNPTLKHTGHGCLISLATSALSSSEGQDQWHNLIKSGWSLGGLSRGGIAGLAMLLCNQKELFAPPALSAAIGGPRSPANAIENQSLFFPFTSGFASQEGIHHAVGVMKKGP